MFFIFEGLMVRTKDKGYGKEKQHKKYRERRERHFKERKKINIRLVWFLFFILNNKNKEKMFDSLCFFILKNTKAHF